MIKQLIFSEKFIRWIARIGMILLLCCTLLLLFRNNQRLSQDHNRLQQQLIAITQKNELLRDDLGRWRNRSKVLQLTLNELRDGFGRREAFFMEELKRYKEKVAFLQQLELVARDTLRFQALPVPSLPAIKQVQTVPFHHDCLSGRLLVFPDRHIEVQMLRHEGVRIVAHYRREIVGIPHKCWLLRLFQRRTRRLYADVYSTCRNVRIEMNLPIQVIKR